MLATATNRVATVPTPYSKVIEYLRGCVISHGVRKSTNNNGKRDISKVYVQLDTAVRTQEYEDWLLSMVQRDPEMLDIYQQQLDEDSLFGVKQIIASRIPTLDQDATVFAFKNGVYDVEIGRFSEHHSGNRPQQYFDVTFDMKAMMQPWKEIQTPMMDKLIESQNLDMEKMWTMLGRTLYPLQQHDYWNCIMYLNGPEECQAKKDILSLLTYMHGENGTVQLAGKDFCTEDISASDARFYIINNVSMTLNDSDRSRLIEWVSGDPTTLKNGAVQEALLVDGAVSGDGDFQLKMTTKDDDPYFKRLVEFRFENHGEESVFEALKEEISAILIKANKAYRENAANNKNRSFLF